VKLDLLRKRGIGR